MNKTILEKIDELFSDPKRFTPENMESIVQETVKFFGELKEQIASPDPKVREEALQMAAMIKANLEKQAMALCESIGMDPKTVETFINTPAHFSPEDWLAMEKAKEEIAQYKDAAIKMESENSSAYKKTIGKKPKKVKNWLVG